MDSREKVLALRQRFLSLQPEDEETAQQLQILGALLPLAMRALPADSAELDGYLRTIAWGAAQCRSDDAPRLALFEWHRPVGEDGRWELVEIGAEG